MTRLLSALLALSLGACAVNLGGPSEIPVPTVAVRAGPATTAAGLAASLDSAGARVAFVAAERDEGWFKELAAAAELTLSGPAPLGDLALAFLGPEPVGDTTHVIEYEAEDVDRRLTVQDALYEIEEDRLLDLLAFRVDEDTPVRPVMEAFLEYVATDVNNSAAVVIAVAVPSAAVGDRVAGLLSPAYFDAARCAAAGPEGDGAGTGVRGAGIRLFYGPEARMFCESAGVDPDDGERGEWVRAALIMGRR